MKEAHEKGTPVMRILFCEFPEDSTCWKIEDQYLYGGDILIAPVLNSNSENRKLYLPKGEWWNMKQRRYMRENSGLQLRHQ